MTTYDLMIKTNHYIIKGGELTASQKGNIANQLLSARSNEYAKQSFYRGVRYTDNIDNYGDVIGTYPGYYIPPYNGGEKLQTVIPMSPKTHILSVNSYELEIIRLLYLFIPDNLVVRDMIRGTLKRLRTACFANDCSLGECFHTSLPALRFIATVSPSEITWINKLVSKFNDNIEVKLSSKQCNSNTLYYFWLCLSELPYESAVSSLLKYQDDIYSSLTKSTSVESDNNKVYKPVLYCIFRNCLCRLPGYEYMKDHMPYISEADGRMHFDVEQRYL